MSKVLLSVLILSLSSFSLTLTSQPGSTYKTITPFTNLDPSWYMIEKAPLAIGAFSTNEAYWGFTAKKDTVRNHLGLCDILTSLNLSAYYLYSGTVKQVTWTTGEFQTDLDSIKSYVNTKWLEGTDRVVNSSKVGIKQQDSIGTYLRIFKSDSIYAVMSLPNKSTIKIYKYSKGWYLKATLSLNASLLKNVKVQNGFAYLNSNNNLYDLTTGQQIQSNVLGFSFDQNDNLWLTTSSGQLSILKNNTRTIVKTDSRYATDNFLVNPIDTTFFMNGKIDNSTYNNEDYFVKLNTPMNWYTYRGFAIDKSGDIWNASGHRIERELNYAKATFYSFYMLPFNRIFSPSTDPEKVINNFNDTIFETRYNFKPFFWKTSFTDSLGYIDEQTKMISYVDTIHAYDNNSNQTLQYSIISSTLGGSLVDSIFTINNSATTGTHTIKFQVRDNFQIPCYDTLTITMKVFSRKISVNKSVTTTATEDIPYNQTITTTDIDNDSSYISSSKLPSWLTLTRTSKNQYQLSGTPVNSTQDTTIKIIFTDNSNYYDPISKQNVNPTYDTLSFNMTITKVNETPIITSTAPTSINFNNQYSYQVRATDEENDPLTYVLTQKPSTMNISSTGLITWSPSISNVGNNQVSVKVSDLSGLYATQSFTITVANNNQPPVFTNFPDSVTNLVDPYVQYLFISDENTFGLILTKLEGPSKLDVSLGLEPQDGLTKVGYLQFATLEVADTGKFLTKIKVEDEYGLSDTIQFNMFIKYDGRKMMTLYPFKPDTNATVNQIYTQTFEAIDKDCGIFNIQTLSLPSWLTVTNKIAGTNSCTSAKLTLTGTPTSTGRFFVKVAASSAGNDTISYYINVAPVPNSAPSITSTPITVAYEDISYSYQITATDVDNDLITYSLISKPQNMTISSTGLIAWTPLQSNVGIHTVSVKVSDGKTSTSQTFNLVVNAVNDKPVITSQPITTAYKGLLYSYQVEAYDVDNDVLYYLIDAPTGMTVSPEGNIIWTPTESQIGVHSVRVKVTDQIDSAIQQYQITVNDVINNPVITSNPITKVYEGQSYKYQVQAVDPNNDPLSYSVQGPTGMTISSTGLIAWSPIQSQVGQHNVIIDVTDDNIGSTQQIYTLTVQDSNYAPVILTSYRDTTIKETDSLILNADVQDPDMTEDSITWFKNTTKIAEGHACKIFSDYNAAGTYQIKVVVRDGLNEVSKNFNLTVLNSNRAPQITAMRDTTIRELDSISFHASVFDPDNSPLTITWFKDSTKISDGPDCKVTTSYTSAGIYTMKVIISDGESVVQKTFTLSIIDMNQVPVVQIKKDTILTLFRINQPVTFNLKALDPDGDRLTYTIDTTGFDMTSILVEVRDSNFVITPKRAMMDTVTLVISDGKTQVKYALVIQVLLSTSIKPVAARTFTNYFKVSNSQIRFGVAKNNSVKLVVYTMNGRTIHMVNEFKTPGDYMISLNSIASGNYVYKFMIGSEFFKANKIQIVK